MENWPIQISKFKEIYLSRFRQQLRPALVFQPQRDQHGVQFTLQEQRHFHVGLEILERLQDTAMSKDYSRVAFNVEVTVFTLWWMGNVSHILCRASKTHIRITGICGIPIQRS
jgi:hypothetical protein